MRTPALRSEILRHARSGSLQWSPKVELALRLLARHYHALVRVLFACGSSHINAHRSRDRRGRSVSKSLRHALQSRPTTWPPHPEQRCDSSLPLVQSVGSLYINYPPGQSICSCFHLLIRITSHLRQCRRSACGPSEDTLGSDASARQGLSPSQIG